MEKFANRFVLEKEIGSGGMSRVYLGRDAVLDRPVAIKVLKPGYGETDIGARFRREGRTAARLSHPNIVQVYDAGEDELGGREVSYIVMEYLPGGDLKDLIDERGALSGGELARLSGVAAGLAHAHGRGVIHRDIKPHNILLDEYGSPKLADFGIARALDATYATRTGSYLGTALYSAPEQLQGGKVTPKSDVYSLGVALYHAATGQPPFLGAPIEVASQHISKEPTPPRQLNDAVSPSLEHLILDCLQKDPDARPTADEVRLGLLEAGRGVHATAVYDEPPARERTGAAQASPAPGIAASRSAGAAPADRRGRKRGLLAALSLVALIAVVGAFVVPSLFGGEGGGQDRSQGERAQGGGANPSGEGGGSGGENERGQAPADRGAETQSGSQQNGSQDGRPAPENGEQAQAEEELTEDAAAQTVEDFYASAAEEDYDTSSELLTAGWRQEYFPTRAAFDQTFGTLESITFEENPAVEVAGNTATVTGETVARHTDRTERNEGTWTLVDENGRWVISEWTVNNISTEPT